jgi:hypothetical protein
MAGYPTRKRKIKLPVKSLNEMHWLAGSKEDFFFKFHCILTLLLLSPPGEWVALIHLNSFEFLLPYLMINANFD